MPGSKELKIVGYPGHDGSSGASDSGEILTSTGSSRDQENTPSYGSVDLPETTVPQNGGESMSKELKLVKTSCMMIMYIGMGFWSGVVSPTSLDVSELYNVTLNTFVRAYSAGSVGLLMGSFTGAFIADKFRAKADFGLFLYGLVGGITILAVPWCPNIPVVAIMFLINGLCHGTLNVVCSTINLSIWGQAAPTPIHGLHMCFTLGTTMAPLIVAPFLSDIKPENGTETDSHDDKLNNHSHTVNPPYSGRVQISYAIFGIWSVAVSLIFLVMFLKGNPYTTPNRSGDEQSLRSILNPATIAGGSFRYGLYLLISLFLVYVFLNGRDRSVGVFLFPIAHEDVLQMSKPIAALLVTSFNLFTALGRGLGALISHWLPIKPFLFIQLITSAFLQLMLFFYGLESNASLWILSALFGIVSGPTYPSIMSWADRYIEATGMVIAVIDIGIGVGGFIALWIYGHIYDEHGSVGVFLLGLIYGVVLLVVLTPLQIVSILRGDRHDRTIPVQRSHSQIHDFRIPESDNEENYLLYRD